MRASFFRALVDLGDLRNCTVCAKRVHREGFTWCELNIVHPENNFSKPLSGFLSYTNLVVICRGQQIWVSRAYCLTAPSKGAPVVSIWLNLRGCTSLVFTRLCRFVVPFLEDLNGP